MAGIGVEPVIYRVPAGKLAIATGLDNSTNRSGKEEA
jgi:hypothetical protein